MLNWFSPGTTVSFTNKTDRHDITVILLKVALNTIAITLTPNFSVIISSDIYDWVNPSAGGVFVPHGIIRPVVSASTLTWFIFYLEQESNIEDFIAFEVFGNVSHY
jgi:hypothetical protein